MDKEKLMMQYADYNDRVVNYMKSLIKRLEDQYGEIDDEWLASLDLIAFNYQIIQDCKADMLKNGIDLFFYYEGIWKIYCYTVSRRKTNEEDFQEILL